MNATRPIILTMLASLALAACAPVEKTEESPKVTASAKPAETTTTTSKPTRCKPASDAAVASIASAVVPNYRDVKFTNGYTVEAKRDERNSAGWPPVILAVRLEGKDLTSKDVATFGTSEAGDGLTLALNELARNATEWGQAAQPGSPVDELRNNAAKTDSAKQAEKCAREGKAS